MKREEVERRLELAETNRQQAAERLQIAEQRLEELEGERSQILGESDLARRSIAELARLADECRSELAAVELEEARDRLAEAVEARDRSIGEAAEALGSAVKLLGAIDEHRAAVADAHQRLKSLDPSAGRAAPDEPDVLHERWQQMVSLVRTELDGELESDIVDAAARSNSPVALNALPQHLRILAEERRNQWHRDRMAKHRESLIQKQRGERNPLS